MGNQARIATAATVKEMKATYNKNKQKGSNHNIEATLLNTYPSEANQ